MVEQRNIIMPLKQGGLRQKCSHLTTVLITHSEMSRIARHVFVGLNSSALYTGQFAISGFLSGLAHHTLFSPLFVFAFIKGKDIEQQTFSLTTGKGTRGQI